MSVWRGPLPQEGLPMPGGDMPVGVEVLRKAEVFHAMPGDLLAQIARLADEGVYETGAEFLQAGEAARTVYVVESGIVGLYVPVQQGEMPFEILGPGRVIGTSLFFRQVEVARFRARALMPSVLVAIPGSRLQGLLMAVEEMSAASLRELLRTLDRRLGDVLRVLTAEEVSFPTEEACPAGRSTHFLAQANRLTGEVRGMCQRQFACDLAEGRGCPMAGLPAQDLQTIWPLLEPVRLAAR